MTDFEKIVEKYFVEGYYNCSEAIIRAANDYYDLKITDEDLLLFGGFGGGMFSGLTCGSLCAGACVLSKMLVKENARKEKDELRPKFQKLIRNFRQILGGTECKEIKPKYYSKEKACLKTVMLAAEALEKTINEIRSES